MSPIRLAFRTAVGVPALVMGSSYLGFGALLWKADFGLLAGMLSTMLVWAMPGQVALVELAVIGAPLLGIALAVGFVNLRMMPMTVSLFPLLRAPGRPAWQYYAAAQLVAVTAWATSMRVVPDLPPRDRLPYFVTFSLILVTVSTVCTAVGWLLAGHLPLAVTLGLVFINPMYFMLLFAGDLSHRGRLSALLLGAAVGPLLHLVDPEWGLLASGLIAGTLGHLLGRHLIGGRRR